MSYFHPLDQFHSSFVVKLEPIKICLVKYKEHFAMKFIWMITSRKSHALRGGGHSKNFDRDARVTFFGLNLTICLFFLVAQI